MSRRFKILIVDDNPINIKLLSAEINDEYDIYTATDGYEAIELLKKIKPDLILLDVLMPGLNGFEVCKIIKSDAEFADISIIFLTVLDTDEGELQGLEVGGIDYVTQPINYTLLKMRIRNHIALKERNDLVKEQRDLLRTAEMKLVEMASIDFLTGLLNRRELFNRLAIEVSRAKRHAKPLSLIIIDIDHFKALNDTYGHNTGDIVLKKVSHCFTDTHRTYDIISRYGGEEFLLVAPETTLEHALELAERLRVAVLNMSIVYESDAPPVKCTISAGVATMGEDEDINRTISRADEALYRAKNAGRNQVAVAK